MIFERVKNWYGKYERPISSLSLIGGFVFDALTLKRVDLFWENLWVIAHLVIVAGAMIMVHGIEKEEGAEANPSKLHFWLVNIIQFFFGGILSTYLVFYFRSSDILVSWPFILILALAFWANEALKRSFVRLTFQISLLYLSFFSFAIFLVPVLLHKISTAMFLLAGFVSLLAIAGFVWIIWLVSKKQFKDNKYLLFGSIAGIYLLINILYFTNLLPPIPLSLKDAGVYYSIQRNALGGYTAVGEEKGWFNYFKLYPDFHYIEGSPVYVFSAVFAPNGLSTGIIHEWQKKDINGEWVTVTQVPIKVNGGRDGGFRAYSVKTQGLSEGNWRVNVKTSRGQVVGTIRFKLISAQNLPKVLEEVK